MPLHRNAATCYSTSFLPADEKFRGEGIGFVYAKRGTSCRDLGRRTMGVMEVTKEERTNSNDRATIEPPPRSIGRRHWFPPVYQLHRSFLLFFFSSSSSSFSSFFFSLIRWMNLERGGETRYTGGRVEEGLGNVCRRLIKRHRSLGRVRSCFCYAIDWKMLRSSDRGFPEMLQGRSVSIFAQKCFWLIHISPIFKSRDFDSMILIQIRDLNLSRENVDLRLKCRLIFIRINLKSQAGSKRIYSVF